MFFTTLILSYKHLSKRANISQGNIAGIPIRINNSEIESFK